MYIDLKVGASCKFVSVLYDILLNVFLIDILLASCMVVTLRGLKYKQVRLECTVRHLSNTNFEKKGNLHNTINQPEY